MNGKDRFDKAGAYWVRGIEDENGFNIRVIPVHDRHIVEICKTPGLFGFTALEVREAFDRHGEKPGFEGYAREELMVKAIRRGWIRVRFKQERGRERWVIQADRHTERRREIERFLAAMREQGYMGVYDEVEYVDVAGDER
jgi:hypothetical protein